MKNFYLFNNKEINEPNLSLFNQDEHSIISEIQLVFVSGSTYQVDVITTQNFSEYKLLELQETFPNIAYNDNKITLRSYFNVIYQFLMNLDFIDPIPVDYFKEIDTIFSELSNDSCLTLIFRRMLVQNESHPFANKIALSSSNSNAFAILANMYEKKNQYENYLDVLEHIPETHPQFREANFHLLQTLIQSSDDLPERTKRIFKAAVNAKEGYIASRYFNLLCGQELTAKPILNNIENSTDALIELAQKLKEWVPELLEYQQFKKQHSINKIGFFSQRLYQSENIQENIADNTIKFTQK